MPMHIQVTRTAKDAEFTLGELTIDGVWTCYTLEDTVREVEGEPVEAWKIPGKTAIPAGEYEVDITFSPHFGHDLPLIENVAGFEGVRIHPGNTAADTAGCLLVGMVTGDGFVGHSREAFGLVFDKIASAIAAGDSVSLSIA